MRNKTSDLSPYPLLLCLLLLCSCAHKSGHRRDNRDTRHRTESREKTRTNVRPTAKRASGDRRMEGSEIFKLYNEAVFMVYTTDGSSIKQGSGFFIGENGVAVSNYHVFKGTGVGNEAIKMPGDDTAYKVEEVYAKSEQEDFILFRVDYDNDTAIPIADRKPSIGDKVFAIGSPRGLENTFSSGEVSQWRDTNLMQISALIDHGSSGGALINEYGEVVGITSGTFADGSQANLNYAWSIDVIKPYIR